MERIPTRPTPLIGDLAIRPHNTITDRTLRLTFKRTLYVPPPRGQRIDQTAVENGDGAETRAQPGLPLLLVDGDAVEAFDVGVGEREGGGQADAHAHCLLVEDEGCGDFARAGRDADAEGVVGGGGGPGGDAGEGGGDDGWRDVLFGPGLEGYGDGA